MNIHLIIGEDDFLVSETAKKFLGADAGLEVTDSLNSTNEDLQLKDLKAVDASVSTPPFLEPTKVTWWKNVHFLPHAGGKAVAATVKEALEKFAARLARANLPENQHVIITGPRLLKTSVFAKTLAAAAEVVVFDAGKPWEAARQAVTRAIGLAEDLGLRFAPGVAEKFTALVGTDTRSLMSELTKLRDYLGPKEKTITADAVDAVTSQGIGVETEVWAITDAIGARNLSACLEAARAFEGENGFAVLVTTVVEKFFRQMLDVQTGRTEGMSPFALKKMTGYLSHWTVTELRIARWRFLKLRERVVSGTTSGDIQVVNELVRVVRKRR